MRGFWIAVINDETLSFLNHKRAKLGVVAYCGYVAGFNKSTSVLFKKRCLFGGRFALTVHESLRKIHHGICRVNHCEGAGMFCRVNDREGAGIGGRTCACVPVSPASRGNS